MFGRNKKKISLIIGSQIFLSLILLGLLAFLLTPTIKNYRQQRAVDNEIESLRQQIAEAEQQNSEFKKMLEYLESDSFAQEQARLNLGLKKPGENVAVVENTIENVLPTTATAELTDDNLINSQALRLLQNLQKWLDYFFGLSQEWESNP